MLYTDHTKYTNCFKKIITSYKFDKINMVSVLWLVHWFGRKRAGLLLVEVRDVKFWISGFQKLQVSQLF